MNIKDKKGKLLASIIKKEDMKGEKYFATDNEQDLQVAKFDLKKDTEILRHIHLEQERKILSTSEVIIITKGEMVVDIYSEELEHLYSDSLNQGDILALFGGGHGLKMSSDCRFIEVKQGPYIEEIDKKRF
tara:strand:+ start:953 stop:1345 length:393 start_codon:yes stop_codon:yes gene_type:complete